MPYSPPWHPPAPCSGLCKTASYRRVKAQMLVVCKPLLVNRPDSRRSTMAQSRSRKSSFRMRVPPGSFVARRADITQKRKARLGRSFLQSMAEPMLTRHWRGICSIPWPQRKIAINVVSASCQLRDWSVPRSHRLNLSGGRLEPSSSRSLGFRI